jgi:hypothetical protein
MVQRFKGRKLFWEIIARKEILRIEPLNLVGTRSPASPSWAAPLATQWTASLPSRRLRFMVSSHPEAPSRRQTVSNGLFNRQVRRRRCNLNERGGHPEGQRSGHLPGAVNRWGSPASSMSLSCPALRLPGCLAPVREGAGPRRTRTGKKSQPDGLHPCPLGKRRCIPCRLRPGCAVGGAHGADHAMAPRRQAERVAAANGT